MATSPNVLSVRNLSTEFRGDRGHVRVLDDVSFDVGRGRIVGLVGESGSGKTVTALSLMGLVPIPPGRVSAELIDLDGIDLAKLDPAGLRWGFQRRGGRGEECAPAPRRRSPAGRSAARSAARRGGGRG